MYSPISMVNIQQNLFCMRKLPILLKNFANIAINSLEFEINDYKIIMKPTQRGADQLELA